MKATRRKLDAYNIQWQTSMALRLVNECCDAVDAYVEQRDQQKRLEVGECDACFYFRKGRVGCAAMTHWWCGICGKRDMWGNTNTPCVCKDCSKKHKLCTHCGGDLEMREGRRKFPEIQPAEEHNDPI